MERLERILAQAEVLTGIYTDDDVAAAERRVADRFALRMLRNALTLDDAACSVSRHTSTPNWLNWPLGGCAAASERPRPGAQAVQERAARDLHAQCVLNVNSADAALEMSAFISSSHTESVGARIFACLLQLTGHDDGARFWWQFSAGAGDSTSALYLYLHHTQHGELGDARYWFEQALTMAQMRRESGTTRRLRELLRLLWLHDASTGGDPACGDPARDAVPMSEQLRRIRHIEEAADDDFGTIPLPEPDLVEEIQELAG